LMHGLYQCLSTYDYNMFASPRPPPSHLFPSNRKKKRRGNLVPDIFIGDPSISCAPVNAQHLTPEDKARRAAAIENFFAPRGQVKPFDARDISFVYAMCSVKNELRHSLDRRFHPRPHDSRLRMMTRRELWRICFLSFFHKGCRPKDKVCRHRRVIRV
jgi:hypothetical protein